MTKTALLQSSAFHLPIHSLDAYIHHVNQIPLLSQAEEQEIAYRLKNEGDLDAARSLVMAHARYVVKIARGYLGYGLPLADLIQEGNIGLMKAVKRFDPEVGVRLVTFAVHWIKSEIHDFVLRNWRIVKVATTKAQRKLFFNLRRAKKQLTWFTEEEIADVAKDLGVKASAVREMEMRLHANDASLDHQDEDEEGQSKALVPAHFLADPQKNPEETLSSSDWHQQSAERLHLVLRQLDERSQDILSSRWLNENKATLQELAEKYNVSAERVRQLEKVALNKLKAGFSSDAF